jgi:EAL domain-containing protein (putative c-di-GMP-specific phosphodiesterase class I)
LLDPAEFVPLAEETGLITPLGEWVLRTACAQNGGWREAGCPPLRMAVNLSTRQFQDQNLVELVKDVLRETGTPAHSLELEITERIATTQNNGLCADLNKLSATGTQISIDDFGIGYSWLGNLKLFPIQTLKIDQSFVKGVMANASDAAIVTAIITMAHSFGFKVIAEGVETEDQLAFLRAQGCDEIQGHLFSPPVPAETLRQILQEEKSL